MKKLDIGTIVLKLIYNNVRFEKTLWTFFLKEKYRLKMKSLNYNVYHVGYKKPKILIKIFAFFIFIEKNLFNEIEV